MVWWTADEEPVNSATINRHHYEDSRIDNTMDVQRAKKCKLWSEGDQQPQQKQQKPVPIQQQQQPPLPADPCPLLQPFCHQVCV